MWEEKVGGGLMDSIGHSQNYLFFSLFITTVRASTLSVYVTVLDMQ